MRNINRTWNVRNTLDVPGSATKQRRLVHKNQHGTYVKAGTERNSSACAGQINTLQIEGFLGKDAVRYDFEESGRTLLKLSLANHRYGSEVVWVKLQYWGTADAADKVQDRLVKGVRILASGQLTTTQYGLEIRVTSIRFL